ncbi:carbohydrate kinase family protein [Aquimarina celericrescens]|uniref:Carbohydrate kinase family protein n=1 Tax=Aquimarina celericrescens TaxID=1964542 RepID=A0ABW5B1C6_9FLAO|nr:carbohydrate kinase family protein [Aquimarina celericrescens]
MIKNKGITAAGNWIIDRTKIIDDYPHQDGLCNIIEEIVSNGGAPYNVLKALSKMGFPFSLKGIGSIGSDDLGDIILKDCQQLKIDTQGIIVNTKFNTSYTDVMTSRKTGRRTFFHYRGANALLTKELILKNSLQNKIFHLGYLLLLDNLDQFSSIETQMTEAAILLRDIRERGIKTSVDLVSENSDRFIDVITPSLPFIDYLFLNEYEAFKLTGIESIVKEKLHVENVKKATSQLLDMGVNDTVFLHFENGAVAASKTNELYLQPKVKLSDHEIKGTAGAGDAFAAGVLYALHEDRNNKEALRWGVATAATSLRHPTCSESIPTLSKILDLYNTQKISSL